MNLRRVAAAGCAVLALSGCATDPNSVAAQAKAGDRKGYVAGDGTIETIPVSARGSAVKLAGATVDGGRFDLGDYRGKVVVVNKWGSWCPPCLAELPMLQALWSAQVKAGAPVQFVGLDYRESAATGAGVARAQGLTYPSLSDEFGLLILDLQGKAAATPTTLVIDTSGRIAARLSGATDAATLRAVLDDVLHTG